VQGVVERHGARVELALGEAGTHAGEERDVGRGAEDEELPEAGHEISLANTVSYEGS
jgi:hypothetical protein